MQTPLRRKVLALWLALITICTAICIYVYPLLVPPSASDRVAKVFGGHQIVKIITAPDRVQIWQTDGFLKSNPNSEMNGDFFLKAGEPTELPSDLAKRLEEIVTYDYSDQERQSLDRLKCGVTPGFIATFSRKGKSVNFFICLECPQMYFSVGESDPSQSIPGGFRDDLMQMMKRLFPADAKVQALH